MITVQKLEYQHTAGEPNGLARVVLRVAETESFGVCKIDLCLIDQRGEPHYASGVIRFDENVASMIFNIGSVAPGRCDGYLLLRCSDRRFELPPVSLEAE